MSAQSPESWRRRCRCSASAALADQVGLGRRPRRPACRAAPQLGQLVGDDRSPGPIRWSAGRQKPIDVDLAQRLPHQGVEPLARAASGAGAGRGCRRGRAGASGRCTMPRMVCRVVCGLLDVIATFCRRARWSASTCRRSAARRSRRTRSGRSSRSLASGAGQPAGPGLVGRPSVSSVLRARSRDQHGGEPVAPALDRARRSGAARATSTDGARERAPCRAPWPAGRRRCRRPRRRPSMSNSSPSSSTCSRARHPEAAVAAAPRRRVPRGRTRR